MRLALREVGADTEWQEIADYPIMIKHILEEKPAEEPTLPSPPTPKGKATARRRRKSEKSTS